MTPYTEIDHEKGFTAFLDADNKRRVARLMTLGAKRRRDWIDYLDHAIKFDSRYAKPLAGEATNRENLEHLITKKCGQEFCFIISSVKLIDARYFSIQAGITELRAAFGGTFLSCEAGTLGLFKYEDGRIFLLTYP